MIMTMIQARVKRQQKKIEEEERHYQYLVRKGYSSASIADLLIHNMLEILKVGIKNQHPEYAEKEIQSHLREIINADRDLRKTCRVKQDG